MLEVERPFIQELSHIEDRLNLSDEIHINHATKTEDDDISFLDAIPYYDRNIVKNTLTSFSKMLCKHDAKPFVTQTCNPFVLGAQTYKINIDNIINTFSVSPYFRINVDKNDEETRIVLSIQVITCYGYRPIINFICYDMKHVFFQYVWEDTKYSQYLRKGRIVQIYESNLIKWHTVGDNYHNISGKVSDLAHVYGFEDSLMNSEDLYVKMTFHDKHCAEINYSGSTRFTAMINDFEQLDGIDCIIKTIIRHSNIRNVDGCELLFKEPKRMKEVLPFINIKSVIDPNITVKSVSNIKDKITIQINFPFQCMVSIRNLEAHKLYNFAINGREYIEIVSNDDTEKIIYNVVRAINLIKMFPTDSPCTLRDILKLDLQYISTALGYTRHSLIIRKQIYYNGRLVLDIISDPIYNYDSKTYDICEFVGMKDKYCTDFISKYYADFNNIRELDGEPIRDIELDDISDDDDIDFNHDEEYPLSNVNPPPTGMRYRDPATGETIYGPRNPDRWIRGNGRLGPVGPRGIRGCTDSVDRWHLENTSETTKECIIINELTDEHLEELNLPNLLDNTILSNYSKCGYSNNIFTIKYDEQSVINHLCDSNNRVIATRLLSIEKNEESLYLKCKLNIFNVGKLTNEINMCIDFNKYSICANMAANSNNTNVGYKYDNTEYLNEYVITTCGNGVCESFASFKFFSITKIISRSDEIIFNATLEDDSLNILINNLTPLDKFQLNWNDDVKLFIDDHNPNRFMQAPDILNSQPMKVPNRQKIPELENEDIINVSPNTVEIIDGYINKYGNEVSQSTTVIAKSSEGKTSSIDQHIIGNDNHLTAIKAVNDKNLFTTMSLSEDMIRTSRLGYKIAKSESGDMCLITLMIPTDAKVVHDVKYEKYRTDRALVLSIQRVYYKGNKYSIENISVGSSDKLCPICKIEDVTHIGTPCRHSACEDCWVKLAKSGGMVCHLCRAEVTGIEKISEAPKNELTEAYSCIYSSNFVYKLGSYVNIHNFDTDQSKSCGAGLHYQTSIDDALKWIEYAVDFETGTGAGVYASASEMRSVLPWDDKLQHTEDATIVTDFEEYAAFKSTPPTSSVVTKNNKPTYINELIEDDKRSVEVAQPLPQKDVKDDDIDKKKDDDIDKKNDDDISANVTGNIMGYLGSMSGNESNTFNTEDNLDTDDSYSTLRKRNVHGNVSIN